MKKIILLMFSFLVLSSCVDASPNIKMDNHISITIDDNNIDGIQGEWKITSDEIEEDGEDVIIIRIEKSELE
ncbi:MAG: hypothetical protein CND26_02315 [Bacteroidetes bacterium MED-G13]|nr:MAG: hypothetical protein CND26_02315 [Bacteroidetes bacterium MED-G13]|tara:strand:+ start:821 stop:1036 length:216 start_codon:yes stop_codon:yes gene_type:complete